MCGVFEQERQGEDAQGRNGAAGIRPGHIRDVDIATADRLKLLIPTEELAGVENLDLHSALALLLHGFHEVLDRLPNILVSWREIRREGQLECIRRCSALHSDQAKCSG